jgi:hypothetical protein
MQKFQIQKKERAHQMRMVLVHQRGQELELQREQGQGHQKEQDSAIQIHQNHP